MSNWRFRKSIGLGKILRLNFSKRGVGVSVGVPGYRISLGTDKKIRKTVSIPGLGLYKTDVIGSIESPIIQTTKVNDGVPVEIQCPYCNYPILCSAEYCNHCGSHLK